MLHKLSMVRTLAVDSDVAEPAPQKAEPELLLGMDSDTAAAFKYGDSCERNSGPHRRLFLAVRTMPAACAMLADFSFVGIWDNLYGAAGILGARNFAAVFNVA